MNRQNHSEPENRLTPEEKQEFLELLAQLSPEQREALKEVLKSFTYAYYEKPPVLSIILRNTKGEKNYD